MRTSHTAHSETKYYSFVICAIVAKFRTSLETLFSNISQGLQKNVLIPTLKGLQKKKEKKSENEEITCTCKLDGATLTKTKKF